MKFSNAAFTISKTYKVTLQTKKAEFTKELVTRKNVFTTMVTTFGVKENIHLSDSVDNQVTMDCLFENA